jgi:hypothetical protein
MTKENFTANVSYWDSYKPLLWGALEATTGDVLEFGCGDGSTKLLHEYCKEKGRNLFSYESDKEWFQKFEHLNCDFHKVEYVEDWDNTVEKHRLGVGVIFIDHAPGERRKYDIALFCNLSQIIVSHDTEQESDHGYRMSLAWPLFKYLKWDKTFVAHATAASNFIDVSKW